jgi:hypothetical protein
MVCGDAAEDRSTYRDLTKAGVDSAIGVGQRFGELLTEMGWDTGVVVYDVGTKQSMRTPAVVRRQLGHDEP